MSSWAFSSYIMLSHIPPQSLFPRDSYELHDMLYLSYPCFTCSAVFVITYIPGESMCFFDFSDCFRLFKTLCFFNYALMIRQDYDITSSLRRGALHYVWLKVSPWKDVVRFRKKGKLAPRFVGPFEIIGKVGPMAYRLDLPKELNGVHDTFHVSNLKKCLADPTLQVPLDEIRVDVKLNFMEEPVGILDREFKKLKHSRIDIVKESVTSGVNASFKTIAGNSVSTDMRVSLAYLKLSLGSSIYIVCKLIVTPYRAIWDTAYWGFLGLRTMVDIFQIILFLYLEYGVWKCPGYSVLVFVPSW
nr:hypothetical protein [Tanacetum cinerariifolium]